jgi:hypothetical protein
MYWKFIARYGCWEVWKTPGKYLACIHYKGVYRYTKTLQEAINIATSKE